MNDSDEGIKGEPLTKIDLLIVEVLLNWVKEDEAKQDPVPLPQFVRENLKPVAEAILDEGCVSSTFIPTEFCNRYRIAQRILKELETLGVISGPNKKGEYKILIKADDLDGIFKD